MEQYYLATAEQVGVDMDELAYALADYSDTSMRIGIIEQFI